MIFFFLSMHINLTSLSYNKILNMPSLGIFIVIFNIQKFKLINVYFRFHELTVPELPAHTGRIRTRSSLILFMIKNNSNEFSSCFDCKTLRSVFLSTIRSYPQHFQTLTTPEDWLVIYVPKSSWSDSFLLLLFHGSVNVSVSLTYSFCRVVHFFLFFYFFFSVRYYVLSDFNYFRFVFDDFRT